MNTRGARISSRITPPRSQSRNPLVVRAVPAVVAVECCPGGDWVVTQIPGEVTRGGVIGSAKRGLVACDGGARRDLALPMTSSPDPGSFNGRTPDFDSGDSGSSPGPGVVVSPRTEKGEK